MILLNNTICVHQKRCLFCISETSMNQCFSDIKYKGKNDRGKKFELQKLDWSKDDESKSMTYIAAIGQKKEAIN